MDWGRDKGICLRGGDRGLSLRAGERQVGDTVDWAVEELPKLVEAKETVRRGEERSERTFGGQASPSPVSCLSSGLEDRSGRVCGRGACDRGVDGRKPTSFVIMALTSNSPWPYALLALALLTTAPALTEGVAGSNRVPGLTLTQTVRAEKDLEPLLDLKHSHESVLDPEGIMTVFWTPDLQKEEVTFEIHARTMGWLGFGFSSSGGMRGSDILIAWVKDGEAFAQDRHGIGNRVPVLDDHLLGSLWGGAYAFSKEMVIENSVALVWTL
ncbi:uncharacterized protein LOC125029944 [Penaeus chinensis]|uniref:uncharacterized protein LOC125029944 n=1 Tax=Penaeus chinensis TaxID=139456 RepID=UPI001FB6FACB|nr:uncharacterized protein LOC125029944 [Penaeus chinensis]